MQPTANIVRPKATRQSAILLGLAWIVGLAFVAGFALPYFAWSPDRFGLYWPRRGWLLLHLAGGIAALLTGPFVLRLGLARSRMALHRKLGMVYIASVACSNVRVGKGDRLKAELQTGYR